ncbi:MAG: acyl-CoA dehydrogenase [Candidatus Eremiobacter antarcticus]|nr:acyl-CoA dehydrogenase family protein [Candidatus Eremiobacteraeota bacterium]PZR60803.1 MAG: acyl-CoA dehydrogenase [Candidatus Eremiobacter sp. RRmetagenome_bin22]
MDFDLSSEQLDVQRLCREFADEEIAPHAQEWDAKAEFPLATVRKMGELGLLGLPFPEKYGGVGADTVSYALAVMEIGRADASVGITMAAHVSLGSQPFFQFGTEAQKQKYLAPLARGEKLWAFGLTEPQAGSDAGAITTTADLKDGRWTINGGKCFITNAGTAMTGGVTITAVTGRHTDGRTEISNIIVPQETSGYTQAPPYKKMGWRASDTRELTFIEAAVPEENLLGERGRGFKQFLDILDGGRISVGALSVGLAQACYDASLKYAKERHQFGQAIARFQAVQFQLVDMAVEIELARTAVLKAAWLKDHDRDFATAAAMSKLFSGEVSRRAANAAVQIHGGYGFMDEYPVSRYWRDCKINEIGEGTNEVQRMVIARQLDIR